MNFYRFNHAFKCAGKLSHLTAYLIGLILLSGFPSPDKTLDEAEMQSYREECLKGTTIYCLSVGIEEERRGNKEEALKYYDLACKNHPTPGHLRACTPLLALAMELGRLDEAAVKLESRCASGGDILCFYLAKEYIKITENHRGHIHLERLCSEDFRLPDKTDYGPCYHLGASLKKSGDLGRARDIFALACQRDPVNQRASCRQHKALLEQIELEGEIVGGVKPFEPIETALFVLALMPFLGLCLFKIGKPNSLRLLRLPVPLVTLTAWALWTSLAPDYFHLQFDFFIIVLSLTMVGLMAWLAHRNLRV